MQKNERNYLTKAIFCIQLSTLCQVWNSISQPLALVADTTATILTMLAKDYGEKICAKIECSKVFYILLLRKIPGKWMSILNKDASYQCLPANSLKIDSVACLPKSCFLEHFWVSEVAAWCSPAIADESQKLKMSWWKWYLGHSHH